MVNLPDDDYIPDGSRTEGEMKTALEALRDVLAQMLGGGSAEDPLTISGGVITPACGWTRIDTEGGASSDDLVTIQTTNLPGGSFLMLNTSSVSRAVTLKNAVGNIYLLGGADVTLSDPANRILLRRESAGWREIYTFWQDAADRRDYFGLGDAATADQGSGNGLDSDTVDGKHASEFLGATAKAADADLLDGVDGANYARKDLSTLQAFLGNLRGNVKVIAYDPSTSTPQFELCDDDAGSPLRRGLLFFDGTNVIIRLYQSNGTTIAGSIKITDTTIEWSPDAESTWYEIWHAGNDGSGSGLDADSIDGYHASSLASASGNVPSVTLNSNYASGTVGGDSYVNISMNRFSFFPSVRCVGGGAYLRMGPVPGTSPSPTTPEFQLKNITGSSHDFDVAWEYLS